MSLIPLLLYLDAVLTQSPVLAWKLHGPGFSAGVEKKMVLIGSPSAAMWTQFPAPGGGVGRFCCWQKTKTDEGWDPGAWDLWLHPACLSPVQAAHAVLGPWVSSNAWFSRGRCSSLAEILEQADLEAKEVVFPAEILSCLRQ